MAIFNGYAKLPEDRIFENSETHIYNATLQSLVAFEGTTLIFCPDSQEPQKSLLTGSYNTSLLYPSCPYEQMPKPSQTHENPTDTVPVCRCTCVHDLQVPANKSCTILHQPQKTIVVSARL